ncbi:MAG: sodium:proton exchanger [Nocardioides sp.]|nr:sodium:proton exchanger [Nocardioides sp.]
MVELLLVALTLLGFALVSRRLSATPVTAPIVFTTVGLVVGTAGLGWFDLGLEDEAATVLIEATLVLVLFSDAARIDLTALRGSAGIPARLLGIGLPLTIALGALVAHLVLGLPPLESALVAAVLAPTDAALGQAVVSDRRLPVRIRQGLNVESGLNDGIALPVVTALLVLADAEERGTTGGWPGFLVAQIGLGTVAGLVVGGVGGALLLRATRAGLVEGTYERVGVLALAVLAYAGASLVGGNGFIAAFVGGMAFGRLTAGRAREVHDFTEDEAEMLTGVTFLVFGAVLAGAFLTDVTWPVLAYAALSLTVVRGVPVVVSMVRSGTRWESRLFLAWFGPRGLASILFALLISEELEAGPHTTTVLTTAAVTVLASIYLHGVTASPWAARLGRLLSAGPAQQAELADAPDLPTRRTLGARGLSRR